MKQTFTKVATLVLLCNEALIAQTPIGTAPTVPIPNALPVVRDYAERAWYRGGNFSGGTAGTNNIFGTASGFNSAIYTQTNGKDRMIVNGDKTGTINGYLSQNTSGFVGIGANIAAQGFPWNTPSTGPVSLLHLNSGVGGFVQTLGWRPWMKYGITSTHNQDFMFMGQRATNGPDVTDAVISWADNSGNGSGPDNMIFAFTEGNGQGTNDLLGETLNGREIMRMTGYGNVGIGPRFNNAQQPQSQLHINGEDAVATYLEISNQLTTGQTVNDGFHLGITSAGIAELNQKENQDMRFFTNNSQRVVIKNAGRVGVNTNTPNNRVEIRSATGDLGFGTLNGSSGLRLTNLLSTNTPIVNPGLGVLSVNAQGDVIYVTGGSGGLTGANNGISINAGVAQLGEACSFANLPAINANSFTTNRMVANRNFDFWIASLNAETGGVGIGGQFVMPFCGTGNTFEVSANSKNPQYGSTNASGMRFTKLTALSPVVANGVNGVDASKVLTVDGDGDVVLTNASNGSSLGNYCSQPQNPLTGHFEVPLANSNFYYSGQQDYLTNVGIGFPCSSGLKAKLHVYQEKSTETFWFSSTFGLPISGTGRFENNATTPNTLYSYGVLGSAQSSNSFNNIGVWGSASNGTNNNYAGYFDGDVYTTGGNTSIAGYISGSDERIKRNVNTLGKSLETLKKLRSVSFYFDNKYAPQLNLNEHQNYGFIAQEVEQIIPHLVTTNTILATFDSAGVQIHPAKEIKGINYDGIIPLIVDALKEVDGRLTNGGLSDAQVKTNIANFNALAKIKTLNPVSYNFTNANVPQLSFGTATDYGFVAQEIETVYPELIDTVRIAETLDTLGNVANPAKTLKTVNYKAMNALLTRAIQEQQVTIDSLKQTIKTKDSLQDARMTAIEAALSACCQNPNTSARLGSNNQPQTTNNQIDIELSDKDVIVLTQNVPNPFAEQTTIAYNVPSTVLKAQIIFYNAMGQIIETVDIKTRGKGKLNVFASDLSSGLYHYTLVADGKVVDSKKMVRE